MNDPNTLPYVDKSKEKVAIVTGASSGIGFYVSLHLYLHGWTVYMVSRSLPRLERARSELLEMAKTRVQNQPLPDNAREGKLAILTVDFADLTTVKGFADRFSSSESTLNLLVNNAGIMAYPFSLTIDGLEIQTQTNQVGPFYLTKLLVPLLQKSEDARIVWSSSTGHYLVFDRMRLGHHLDYFPQSFWSMVRYGNTKAANLHSAKVFAERHPDILSSAVHPGYILDTNILVHYTGSSTFASWFYSAGFKAFSAIFGIPQEHGAYSILFAALAPTLDANTDNGKYYLAYGIEARPSFIGRDIKAARESVDWTERQLAERNFL